MILADGNLVQLFLDSQQQVAGSGIVAQLIVNPGGRINHHRLLRVALDQRRDQPQSFPQVFRRGIVLGIVKSQVVGRHHRPGILLQHLAVDGRGLVRLPLLLVQRGGNHGQAGMVRVSLSQVLITGNGGVQGTFQLLQAGQGKNRLLVFRVQLQGLIEILPGQLRAAGNNVKTPQKNMVKGILRPLGQLLFNPGQDFLPRLFLLDHNVDNLFQGWRRVGIDFQHLFQLLQGQLVLALLPVDGRQAHAGLKDPGIEFQGFLQSILGQVRLLVGQVNPGQLQAHLVIVGSFVQHGPVFTGGTDKILPGRQHVTLQLVGLDVRRIFL